MQYLSITEGIQIPDTRNPEKIWKLDLLCLDFEWSNSTDRNVKLKILDTNVSGTHSYSRLKCAWYSSAMYTFRDYTLYKAILNLQSY